MLKNGPGPVVMIRAELDALPILEKTGLPYASHVTTHNSQGMEVPVMHACGHDLHMAIGMGTATLLAHNKGRWHGTFIYVGQPAEEAGQGASAMLKDGLFTWFPRPDFAIALHDTAPLPFGQVGFTPGYAASAADSVDVTLFGRGGHGAMPQETIDPIVIAARTVLAWQTIMSRESDPRDMGIITVGSIYGGTKHNIIPDHVHLQLTVRSYKPEVRQHLLRAIERIADGEVQAAGAATKPLVKVSDNTSSVYNVPLLIRLIAGVLRRTLGKSNVIQQPPLQLLMTSRNTAGRVSIRHSSPPTANPASEPASWRKPPPSSSCCRRNSYRAATAISPSQACALCLG